MIVDYLAVGRAALGAMPTQECLVLERFFDDTGGMQLVVHSPYGGRINRALGSGPAQEVLPDLQLRAAGRRHRRRRRPLARPAPQLPLEEVPRYVSSRTVARHPRARHPGLADVPGPLAVEPQPVADGAALPRRPAQPAADPAHGIRRPAGGRVPPGRRLPGQRRRPDRDPRPPAGPPDDRRHPARGPRRRRAASACSSGIEAGEVRVHCCDTTEASVLAHEIVTARPYAFLDDEEFQNRRTNAVRLRRGLNVDLAAIGALDPDAIDQVHAEIAPTPDHRRRSARPAVLTGAPCRPGRSGGRCGTTWPPGAAAGLIRRAVGRAVVHDRVASATPGWPSTATTAPSPGWSGATWSCSGDHHRRPSWPARPPSPRAGSRSPWPRSSTRASPFRAATPPTPRTPMGGAPAAGPHAQLLPPVAARARPAGHRPGLHALPPALAARRSRHPARRRRGLAAVIEQLQGFEAAAVAWEPELLARRLRHYSPGLAGRPLPRRRGGLAPTGARGLAAMSTARRPRRPRPPRSRWCSAPTWPGCWRRPGPARRPLRPPSAPPPRSSTSCERRGASFAADLARRPGACPTTWNAACGTA